MRCFHQGVLSLSSHTCCFTIFNDDTERDFHNGRIEDNVLHSIEPRSYTVKAPLSTSGRGTC